MKHESGFTLLEILVALVVLGFLMLGLGRTTQFGIQAWSRQDRAIDAHAEMDAVDRTLRSLITRLDPAEPVAGTPHTLAFTSRLPQSAALATHEADMALGLDPAHTFVLAWRPHLHAKPIAPAAPPAQSPLLPGLSTLDFAYFSPTAGAWQDTWSARQPPAMIRIRIRFPASDPRHWPDIIASPLRTLPDQ